MLKFKHSISSGQPMWLLSKLNNRFKLSNWNILSNGKILLNNCLYDHTLNEESLKSELIA